jgi:YD repeat-containing protein
MQAACSHARGRPASLDHLPRRHGRGGVRLRRGQPSRFCHRRNADETAYGYDNANRMTTVTFPEAVGVVSTYTYDDADRLTAIAHVQGESTLAYVDYTLDAVGNRTQRVDGEGTHSYSYDDLYRLTQVTYPGPSTTSYAFDAFGNRTSMTKPGNQTTTYAYDDADRLTSVTPPGESAIDYTWDDNGDLTDRATTSSRGTSKTA